MLREEYGAAVRSFLNYICSQDYIEYSELFGIAHRNPDSEGSKVAIEILRDYLPEIFSQFPQLKIKSYEELKKEQAERMIILFGFRDDLRKPIIDGIEKKLAEKERQRLEERKRHSSSLFGGVAFR